MKDTRRTQDRADTQDKTRQDKTVAPVVQDSLKILRDTQKHLIVTANTVSPKQPKGTKVNEHRNDGFNRTNELNAC